MPSKTPAAKKQSKTRPKQSTTKRSGKTTKKTKSIGGAVKKQTKKKFSSKRTATTAQAKGRSTNEKLPKNGAPCECICQINFAEVAGTTWKSRASTAELRIPKQGRGGTALSRQAKKLASPPRKKQISAILQAAASPHRIAILAELLQGPATYQALLKATGLKVGPLYHHINQLRMASLVAPKERDLYRLTNAGRNLLVILLAMLPLTENTRPLEVV